eukprot:CAMPEP_0206268074 /NCGR_PEP_ID=MMETSP0047_2-20121206/31503_1 /ASSEMBLY_ACC=CAM_ASM_000192 /TAXON_ID=195065 /ORGANISM="Chroomonas mesostigmatica_cf, Strain CCMP1168" /LENGTH=543 /DNA_ID=CAMNT_0053696349 /DNA_START=6 /DNA_END=1636 /DNA_ORIENTATION=+
MAAPLLALFLLSLARTDGFVVSPAAMSSGMRVAGPLGSRVLSRALLALPLARRPKEPRVTMTASMDSSIEVTVCKTTGIHHTDLGRAGSPRVPGTQSSTSTVISISKVIVGGIAPLLMPWAIKSMGVLGGSVSAVLVGLLSSSTVNMLISYRDAIIAEQGSDDLNYVDVVRHAFGNVGARGVFAVTFLIAIGVCGAYLKFIGNTMAALSLTPGNVVHTLAPGVSAAQHQLAAAAAIVPLCALSRHSTFMAFAALLGAAAVAAAVLVTCVYGLTVTPNVIGALSSLPLITAPSTFFSAFGVIPLLFCVHWVMFPIERAMKKREKYNQRFLEAVWICIAMNAGFGLLGYGFFGKDTNAMILNNLGDGPLLTIVRLSLVVDMIISAPIMLNSLREIVEKRFVEVKGQIWWERTQRLLIRTALVMASFGVAQLSSLGEIANLVGGVAQCVLAFIVPPALAIKGVQTWGTPQTAAGVPSGNSVSVVGEQQSEIDKIVSKALPYGGDSFWSPLLRRHDCRKFCEADGSLINSPSSLDGRALVERLQSME